MARVKKQILHNALPTGHKIQWYEIKDVLGLGGFGITYLAHDVNLDHEVAIKEYMPAEMAVRLKDGSLEPSYPELAGKYHDCLNRFIDEARTIGRFRHPNIVRVRNVFELNNTAYMVMDYELGETLQDVLTRHKILDAKALQAIISPILDGLQQVHDAGFIHRDIKPANIFIRVDGEPVLLDFGSARKSFRETEISMTGFYSRGYAPIEQYNAEKNGQGPWTDIYSLGATLYRAIAGVAPIDATDRMMTITRTGRDPYVLAEEIGAGEYPAHLLEAIDHALAFEKEKRPQSISEWRAMLEDAGNLPVSPPDGFKVDLNSSSDKKSVFQLTLKEANNGNVVAMSNMGFIYAKGIGVEKNEAEALAWYKKAAEKGHLTSQYNLGVMYSKGRGTTQDFGKSFKWYKLAAKQGDVMAQATVAMMYAKGIGTEKNYVEAVNWYERAAVKGHANSQHILANMYMKGRGVEKNMKEAFKLYKAAANYGHINAQLMLAYLYGKGQGVKRDDTRAYYWYLKAAEQGNPNAQYNLGVIYAKGRGIKKDIEKARYWYQQAADQGDENAQAALDHLA